MDGKPFEVTAPDPLHRRHQDPSPNAALVEGGAQCAIMPKHVLEDAYKKRDFASAYNVSTPPDKIVTSGPWRVLQYVPGEKTVLGAQSVLASASTRTNQAACRISTSSSS